MGILAAWDMALQGQRWLPAHRRGPSVLVLPTWRGVLGHTSSWALGCRIQISGPDFRPACPRVSGFRLIPGLAGVKNREGAQGLGAGKLRAGL